MTFSIKNYKTNNNIENSIKLNNIKNRILELKKELSDVKHRIVLKKGNDEELKTEFNKLVAEYNNLLNQYNEIKDKVFEEIKGTTIEGNLDLSKSYKNYPLKRYVTFNNRYAEIDIDNINFDIELNKLKTNDINYTVKNLDFDYKVYKIPSIMDIMKKEYDFDENNFKTLFIEYNNKIYEVLMQADAPKDEIIKYIDNYLSERERSTVLNEKMAKIDKPMYYFKYKSLNELAEYKEEIPDYKLNNEDIEVIKSELKEYFQNNSIFNLNEIGKKFKYNDEKIRALLESNINMNIINYEKEKIDRLIKYTMSKLNAKNKEETDLNSKIDKKSKINYNLKPF